MKFPRELLRPQFPQGDIGLGKNPVAVHGSPVAFTAGVKDLAPGQNKPFDTKTLQPGYRTPYFVDEIRMQAYTTDEIASNFPITDIGMLTRFQFRTGNHAFSKKPIPMLLHGQRYTFIEQLEGSYDGTHRVGFDVRWRLPQPLWLGVGDVIQCIAELDQDSTEDVNLNVDIAYVGRSFPPGTPTTDYRCVPWLAYYRHDCTKLFSHTYQEFLNPFTVPWNIHRLTGRVAKPPFPAFPPHILPDANHSPFISIKIYDSLGYKMTGGGSGEINSPGAVGGDFVPFGNVFETARDSWTFSRSLNGKEQLDMEFSQQDVFAEGNAAFVGAVGYREEG